MNRPNALTDSQLGALCRFVECHGRFWKSKLRTWWLLGNHDHPDAALLQQIRNEHGALRFTTPNLAQWAEELAILDRASELHDSDDVTVGGSGKRLPMVDIVDEGAWVQAWVWVPNELEESEEED